MFLLSIFLVVSLISQAFSISSDLRDDILAAHNKFRRQVAQGKVSGQPAAGDMMEMVWSDELAATAENSANRCVFEHDNDQDRATKSFPDAGQNIYAGWAPNEAVKLWFDENKDYSYNTEGCNGVCGHYTQIAWAQSYAVGCASVHCEGRNGFQYKYFVVCNYGPAGNYMGEKPYKAGSACSSCPADSTCNDGLCSKSGGGEKTNSKETKPTNNNNNYNNNNNNNNNNNKLKNRFNRFQIESKFPGLFGENEITFEYK